MKIFVASTRGTTIDKYRQIAIEQIGEMKDVRGRRWTAVTMERDAYPDTGCDTGHLITEQWGPGYINDCNAVLLLVSTRYGTLVKGREISITELEYQRARERGINVMAWLYQKDSVPDTEYAKAMAYDLEKEAGGREDHERALAFCQRIRDDRNLISRPLPLTLDGIHGFPNLLRNGLTDFQRKFESSARAAPSLATSSPYVTNEGVRAQISGEEVTVTWESTLQHGGESIQSPRASWHEPGASLLAVRRAGTDAAYVVLRTSAGTIVVRVSPDGSVKTASLIVSGIVQQAKLMGGEDIGDLTLHLTDGHVTTVRTDKLNFRDLRNAHAAQI